MSSSSAPSASVAGCCVSGCNTGWGILFLPGTRCQGLRALPACLHQTGENGRYTGSPSGGKRALGRHGRGSRRDRGQPTRRVRLSRGRLRPHQAPAPAPLARRCRSQEADSPPRRPLSAWPSAIVAGLVVGITAMRSDSFALSFGDVSTDEPGTWTQLPLSGNGGNVTSVAVDPNVPGVVYAMTDNGLFKSTDGAASWTQLLKRDCRSAGAEVSVLPEVSVSPDSSSTVFVVGDRGSSVVRSASPWMAASRGRTLGWPGFRPDLMERQQRSVISRSRLTASSCT